MQTTDSDDSRPRIPQELLDQILDSVAASTISPLDGSTKRVEILSHCTLVCRAWLPCSSKYLLQTVCIRGADDLRDCMFVASQSARLTENVVDIYFSPTHHSEMVPMLASYSSLSARLPRFRFLSLYRRRADSPRVWADPSPTPRPSITPIRCDIHLELSQKVHILRCFSHIDTLTLNAVRDVDRDAVRDMERSPPGLTVNTLVISGATAIPGLILLYGLLDGMQLSSLAVLSSEGFDLWTVSRILHHTRETVTRQLPSGCFH